jgi:hypothetical protein
MGCIVKSAEPNDRYDAAAGNVGRSSNISGLRNATTRLVLCFFAKGNAGRGFRLKQARYILV